MSCLHLICIISTAAGQQTDVGVMIALQQDMQQQLIALQVICKDALQQQRKTTAIKELKTMIEEMQKSFTLKGTPYEVDQVIDRKKMLAPSIMFLSHYRKHSERKWHISSAHHSHATQVLLKFR